jgi:hypothetical protein
LLDVRLGTLRIPEDDNVTQAYLATKRSRPAQVRSLEMTLAQTSSLRDIFVVWADDYAVPSLDTFSMVVVGNRVMDRYGPRTVPSKVLRETANPGLFPGIKDIRIRRGYFDWECSAFEGLVHLQLCDIPSPVCPTLEQLLHMLEASPQLRTLALGQLRVWPEADVVYPMVQLN